MLLAVVNMTNELWKLFWLLVAIFQPLLIILLCLGFIVASIHLLTMLGTRWGNRRVSSKAMFFSLSIHALLVVGMVALIPEYRRKVFATVGIEEREVRVAVSIDRKGPESSVAGQATLLDRLRRTTVPVTPKFTRPDKLPDPFESPVPEINRPQLPSELPDVEPARMAPEVSDIAPDRTAATEPVLNELARFPLQEPMPRKETPTEPERSPALMARSVPSNTPIDEAAQVDRPGRGAIDTLAEPSAMTPQPQSLNLPMSEEATLAPGNAATIASRAGVAPTPAITDPRTGQEVPETTRPAARPVPPSLTRSRLPGPAPTNESVPEIERPRSPVPGSMNGLSEAPMLSSGPSLPEVTSKGEIPFLARIESAPPGDGQLPATYQMRTPDLQAQAIRQFGGTDASEQAVQRSLAFLASAQSPDGHWDVGEWEGGLMTRNPDGAPRVFTSADLDTGVTALATLAFLGKLNTLEQGQYSEQVQKSIRWLIQQQKPNGFLGLDPGGTGRGQTVPGNMAGMYGHAMATFALAEAYAMSRNHPDAPKLRVAVERGVAFIIASQLEDGGWRYFQYQTQGGDMSIFGWQLMALKSAQLGGVTIPARVKEGMVQFARNNGRGTHGGLGTYRSTSAPTAAMTAEALFCRQILGASRDAAASREAVESILSYRNLPSRQKYDLYYWYYGTLAMFQYGGEEWQLWNKRVRDLLIFEQVSTGPNAGSWEPRDPWSGYGGRIYSTAVATLCLEIYYRYLPLYQETSNPSVTPELPDPLADPTEPRPNTPAP